MHLFSWPEHCRTYLTRVATCRMRHPQWQTGTPEDEVGEESSLNDSLKDVQDMSLRLSVDGDKSSLNESLNSGDAVEDQVKRVLSKMTKHETDTKNSEGPKKPFENKNDGGKKPLDSTNKYPMLRKRRRLIVIAIDCYDKEGEPEKKMSELIQDIFKAVRSDPQTATLSGFALSTAMPLSETLKFLSATGVQVNEFDALICSSGSQVYYPGVYVEEDGKLFLDPDYASHIDYRWGYDGLKKTIWKLMNISEGGGSSKSSSSTIEEDGSSSNAHCISYFIKDPSKVMRT